MASRDVFRIDRGPNAFDLVLAYLKAPCQVAGGFRATFTLEHADGERIGHVALEIHGFERVLTEVDGHMIMAGSRDRVGTARPCPFCGSREPADKHEHHLQGFYDTRSRVGFLTLSGFSLDCRFKVEPGTKRILNVSGKTAIDAVTGEVVENPRTH